MPILLILQQGTWYVNDQLQTLHNGRSLVDRDCKEDFLIGTKKPLTEIECRVHDMLHIINSAFVQHEKDMRDIVSRGKCPDCVRDVFILLTHLYLRTSRIVLPNHGTI